MVLTVWSPKGGSGTSVVTAALALVLARRGGALLADLAGDQPAVLGLAVDPDAGLADWLAAVPDVAPDALERLTVEAAPGLAVLPRGPVPVEAGAAAAEALSAALRAHPAPVVVDAGTAADPASQALAAAADATVVVLHPCYLALRRAVRSGLTARSTGAVLVADVARALGTREVADVLGIPVLARIPARASVARAVDAGVLAARLPEHLGRPARAVLERLGLLERPVHDQAA